MSTSYCVWVGGDMQRGLWLMQKITLNSSLILLMEGLSLKPRAYHYHCSGDLSSEFFYWNCGTNATHTWHFRRFWGSEWILVLTLAGQALYFVFNCSDLFLCHEVGVYHSRNVEVSQESGLSSNHVGARITLRSPGLSHLANQMQVITKSSPNPKILQTLVWCEILQFCL